MWSLLYFIMGTATLLLVNGQLQSPVPFQEQSKQCRKSLSKLIMLQNEFYYYGATVGNFNGVELKVYDRERTICDCFKYRSKLDNEIFNKAINAYVADPKKESRKSF